MLIASLETSEDAPEATLRSLIHLVRSLAGQVEMESTAAGARLARVRLDAEGLERLTVALALAGATICTAEQLPVGGRTLVVIGITRK